MIPAPHLTPLLALGLPLGALVWSFAEYALHRFAFHEASGRNYGSREHLRHHGSDDTVLESWYLSWAGVLVVSLVAIPAVGGLIGAPDLGWGIGLGYLVGYAFYDWIHWRAHRRPIRSRYEARVRKHHFTHHFHTPLQNHGVTSSLWDRVFGTLVEVDVVVVPRRMAPRWLVDDEGRLRDEYADTYVLRGDDRLDERQRGIDRARAFANQAPAI